MAGAQIEIREATSVDIELVADIGSRSFREAYAQHSSPSDLESHMNDYFSVDSVRDEIEQHDRNYLLAVVDDQAGGIAKFRRAPCPVAGGDANAVELQQLYVLAKMQGLGLGWKLVDRLVDEARKADANGVWLSAWEFADWATGFYRKAGFAEIGTVEFKLGETIHTDLLMWMSLE